MLAQLGARLAAVYSVVERLYNNKFRALLGVVGTAITLGGCVPTTVPLIGADPADPGAKVASVRYRSTVAPYTSLRPTAPLSWRQQRDRAPASKSGE